MAFELTSPAFQHNGTIPARYTGDGAELSPALEWQGVPEAAQSLALVVDDPDAPDPDQPRERQVHWLVYNLPAEDGGLPEGVTVASLPEGASEGLNDGYSVGYMAPLPVVGEHRYFFRLYALAAPLTETGAPFERGALERAMSGLVLAHTELVGRYRRPE